jgi:D-sedoheptulose 7-phosphate isomerase
MIDVIVNTFNEHIDSVTRCEPLAHVIEEASHMLVGCLLSDNKILCAGNGSSLLPAQLFVSCLINKYETERPGLPALLVGADSVTVSGIAAEGSAQEIYSKQVRAIGNEGDVLIVCSVTGSDSSLVQVVRAARDRGINVIALTGANGGDFAALLTQDDLEIRVPAIHAPRITELHILIVHCLCDLIDQHLFGHSTHD